MILFAISFLFPNRESWFGFSVQKTPAICTTLERAKEIIEKKEGHRPVIDHHVRYALIETVATDVIQRRTEPASDYKQWWYEWNQSKDKYVPCKVPKGTGIWIDRTQNLAIS